MAEPTTLNRLLGQISNDSAIAVHLDMPVEEVRAARAAFKPTVRSRYLRQRNEPTKASSGTDHEREHRKAAEYGSQKLLKALLAWNAKQVRR